MNINLANIDFNPGQGGGGSLTPEEQEALDTLVDSSEGVLYTQTFKRYYQDNILLSIYPYAQHVNSVFWDDMYISYGQDLYKLNRESYQFELMAHFDQDLYTDIFKDKSGRLYCNLWELNLDNGSLGPFRLNPIEMSYTGSHSNIFYGEYAVWTLGSNANKFNETSREFEVMTLNSTFSYTGMDVYKNLFKYDGHILGVYSDLTFEVTEYEDHIDVADVTGVYFNMPSFSTNTFGFKSIKDGDLYYISNDGLYIYDKSLGDWVNINYSSNGIPINSEGVLVSDNILFLFDYESHSSYINLGQEFSTTVWTKPSSVAVDLKSYQIISGEKTFNGGVILKNGLSVNDIYDVTNISGVTSIYGKDLKITSDNITFLNNKDAETVIKNGSKQIATVDQTFMNSTFIPYGTDGDSTGYFNEYPEIDNSFTTHTKRLFNKYKDFWNEFTGTNKPVEVSFSIDFSGSDVKNSPSSTILVTGNNTYTWNDGNTSWDLLCSSDNITSDTVWFDGENFRSGNTYKLVETEGVWSWVSDPLTNNIWQNYSGYGYINNDVYVIERIWLMKYDKVNCVFNKVGVVDGSPLWSYFDKLFISRGDKLSMIDLSKADPQDPNSDLRGEILHTIKFGTFVGATDRLWYYNEKNEMCSLYQYIYEKPEVPASDGTYTLKAVRAGDQITYNWVLDA